MRGTADILLVEDNPGDIRLTQEAFRRCKHLHNLHIVTDGVRAMKFLRREGEYQAVPEPDLVLLDLNMPRKGGLEVLAEIKADHELRRIPVVILTTSDSEHDVRSSYDRHANCYITKPVDMKEFLRVIELIEDHWLRVAVLPSRG
jgi:CheY-like chemotaxis protein